MKHATEAHYKYLEIVTEQRRLRSQFHEEALQYQMHLEGASK